MKTQEVSLIVPNTRQPSWPVTDRETLHQREREKTVGRNTTWQQELSTFTQQLFIHGAALLHVQRGWGWLTCADGEVGDVLVPEGLFVGSSISQQAESWTTDHCDLRTVARLVQQPLSGQFVLVKGAAAGGRQGGGRRCDRSCNERLYAGALWELGSSVFGLIVRTSPLVRF